MTNRQKASVSLRPMNQAEFDAWLPIQTRDYAKDKTRAGNWSSSEALQLAQNQMSELLSQGVNTPGHRLWVVEDTKTRTAVGSLWVNIKDHKGGPQAFIYNIEMDESKRGSGFGTATIEALEDLLRKEGVKTLLLHVFGYNTAARRLYERVGFEITNINMAKKLQE